jgi:hypothetical protein
VPDPVLNARRAVRALAKGEAAVVLAGPWSAEVGYELLYWIPFLHWVKARHPEVAERTVVVSRGGVNGWYAGLCRDYVDLFDRLDPARLAALATEAEPETRGSRKQMAETTVDRRLLDDVAAGLGLERPAVLHPAVMFQAYWGLVKAGAPHHRARPFLHRPLAAPPLGPLAGELPEDYVAVRFYFSAAFPDTEQNRRVIATALASLTETTHVLLLNPAMRFDDHVDFEPTLAERVVRIDHLMTPANNLHLQTVAISPARAFVGTYGGLSYLPPLFRVPSIALYSDPARFRVQHLEAAQRAYAGPEFGDLIALDARHGDLLALVLGARRGAFL